MIEKFAEILTVGGHSNSLGRAEDIVQVVLDDKSRLEELYSCMFDDDAWVRMRAADAIEKVCRIHPEWLVPYVDRLFDELGNSAQPSIQWHLAQMFVEIELSDAQKEHAIDYLVTRLEDPNVDWIVAANSMNSLTEFMHRGSFAKEKLVPLLERQLQHRSNSVVKRATKILATL